MIDEQDDPLQKAIDAAKAAQGDPLQAAIDAARKKKPRGYRSPEAIARLNRNDQAQARGELGPWQTIAGGLQSAGQGLTLGFGDEIAAGLRTAPWRSGDYPKNLADVREEQHIFQREHPKADVALQMAGGGLVGKPIAGAGVLNTAKNAALLGGVAGTGYADGDMGDRAAGGVGGALTGLTLAGLLGGAGMATRGAGRVLRRMTASNSEKALAYLQKLAAARGGGDVATGLSGTARDVAAAQAAGGQPIMAEGLGESGLRGLQATTTAPLSQAGEITRTALNTRGRTVLPRADAAALKAVGLGPQSGVRGPEYVNDWLDAIRTNDTRPLYAQATAEATAKADAPRKAQSMLDALMEKAKIKMLPAPGQSVITKQALAEATAREPQNIGAPSAISKQATDAERAVLRGEVKAWRGSLGPKDAVPGETAMQRSAREALERHSAPVEPTAPRVEGVPAPRRIVVRAANDINVRNPEYVAPPKPPIPGPTAVDKVRGLVGDNSEVQALVRMLKSDPKQAHLMDDPTSYEAMEALYHAANARIRDLTGGTARSRVQEKALGNIAASFLSGMEEIAPTARKANKLYAQRSQPQESFAFGREFDKASPEALDKAIQTGYLPDGTQASLESIRLGVVQRLREILVKRAGSQVLSGAAKGKDALAGLNNEQLNRQLKVALGDKYDDMVPVIRQLLHEEGTRMYATGGKNVAEGVVPDGANLADVFGAFSGGLGFGVQAAARRTTAAALKGGIKEKIALGFGKGADERARMLTSSGQTLSDWLKRAGAPRAVPWEEKATRSTGGRLSRALLSSILNNPDDHP